MKIKYLISFVIIGLALIGSVDFINKVLAQETVNSADIKYPVVELGNQKVNPLAGLIAMSPKYGCLFRFRGENNLMSEKMSVWPKVCRIGKQGSGRCSGKRSCNTYCDDITHIDECVAFAEKTV